MEIQDLALFKKISRENYYNIWQKVKRNEQLLGEDKIAGELMKQHSEYYEDWDSTDFDYEYSPETDEVNPFLHLQFDTIIMNQITSNSPPQTKLAYDRLREKGKSHLDSLHKLASVIVEEIWNIIKYGKEFNEKNYIRNLKKIK
jgi:hypothetical protein